MIAVDELVEYTHFHDWRDGWWCHLTTDGDREELHAFARTLGLPRAWFQDHPTLFHYDLRPAKRALAVRHGAREVKARVWLQELIEQRRNREHPPL